MGGLRLPRLPERTPVRLSLSISPELNQALHDYADLYRETYGTGEPVAELVPAMLTSFLAGDRQFSKRQKERSE